MFELDFDEDILNVGRRGMFTGHRPERIPEESVAQVKEWLRHTVESLAKEYDVFSWAWGGARGVDQWGARAAVENRFTVARAYLPFPDMQKRWDYDTRKEFDSLIKHSSEVKIFSPEYSNKAYWLRDKAMVDDADVCVAVWDGNPHGGTYITVSYAINTCQKPTIVYNPVTHRVSLHNYCK